MKLKKIILATLLFTLIAFSQEKKNATLKVSYSQTLSYENLPSFIQNAFLTINDKASLYEIDVLNEINFIDEQEFGDGKDGNSQILVRGRPESNPVFFKSLEDRTLYSYESVFHKLFIVKDTYDAFKWTVKDDYKTILGYNCQKAILDYRGRNYTAYFTLEIPFNAGPWKFSGLPGTILEIKEENNVFNIVANKVIISNVYTTINNPFDGKDTISWDAFLEKYKKKYYELKSYVDPNGTRFAMRKKNIEVYIED